MQAAAVLPLVAILTLIAGRRGNAQFCLWGGQALLGLCLTLAISGPVWVISSYLAEVLPYHARTPQMLAPLFRPEGFAWFGALIVWLGGWLAVFCAFFPAKRLALSWRGENYALKQLITPIFFGLMASFLFFAAFIFERWPFAGLPEGLGWDRAIMAIGRHGMRACFSGFCPAGAIALALWPLWKNRLADSQVAIATRWLSFWAIAGAVPSVFSSWGMTLGASVKGAAIPGLSIQLYALSLFTIAIGCWAYSLWKPRYLALLAWPALALLLLKTCLPIIVAYTQ